MLIGILFAAQNRNSSQMFAAGGQSPWWVAGLSGFMTMFSAGTFVVWGGIAFKHGMVAIAINICYGLAALLAGWSVAGKWKQSGIETPAEYVKLRFGTPALHFYTWAIMSFKIVSTAVALYSLCVLMVAMMPLSAGNPLQDPATGNLSLTAAIAIAGGVVVLYTMLGGLWGVLMTDVLQFIVLNLAVLFVLPLAILDIGGVNRFFAQAPEGFLSPTGGSYTWLFLAGWIAIHYFVVGAEWAFVQRCLCVPRPVDARKGVYLFGILYLLSPLIWLMPPMIQRIRNPIPSDASEAVIGALAESAYIDICYAVLPAGMIGLMLAAMFSATASMVSSQLNVFAGVLTHDILRPNIGADVEASVLVWAGRGFTLLLGLAIVGLALSIPLLGGAESLIVPATSLMVGPLLVPLLVGLLSKRLPEATVWITAVVCCSLIIVAKVGIHFVPSDWLSRIVFLNWLQTNGRSLDILLGVVLPIIVVLLCFASGRGVSPGWNRLVTLRKTLQQTAETTASRTPASIVAWSLVGCGTMMGILATWSSEGRLLMSMFAFSLWVLACVAMYAANQMTHNNVNGFPRADP